MWHIDGNDKLVPFGFGIHGCIDGFSRNLLWLKVYWTNKDPHVVAGYYMEAVKENMGCPLTVRADPGTENVNVKRIQTVLADNNRDNQLPPYIEGSSTANQRIESFWSHLRKQLLEFWLCLFHGIQDEGHYQGDLIDKNIMRFAFMGVIQVITQGDPNSRGSGQIR